MSHGHCRQTSARDLGAAQRSCTTEHGGVAFQRIDVPNVRRMTTSSAVHRPWRIRPRRRTGQGLATGATIYYLPKNAFGSDTDTLILIQSIYVNIGRPFGCGLERSFRVLLLFNGVSSFFYYFTCEV